MVGDTGKIERGIDLDVVAERVLDRLALEILVGIARTGNPVAEGPGIERPAGVNVRLTKIRVAKGIALRRRRRCEAQQKRGAACHNRRSIHLGLPPSVPMVAGPALYRDEDRQRGNSRGRAAGRYCPLGQYPLSEQWPPLRDRRCWTSDAAITEPT